MDGEKEIESWYCGCPYDGEICKHVMATLLAIRDNRKRRVIVFSRRWKSKRRKPLVLEEIKKKWSKWRPCPSLMDMQQLLCLSIWSPGTLEIYLWEYASTDPVFKTALSNHFLYDDGISFFWLLWTGRRFVLKVIEHPKTTPGTKMEYIFRAWCEIKLEISIFREYDLWWCRRIDDADQSNRPEKAMELIGRLLE